VNMANPHKLGWNKIHACAKQAKRDKLQYIWVDTCCRSVYKIYMTGSYH
jgi:hypothetical protein